MGWSTQSQHGLPFACIRWCCRLQRLGKILLLIKLLPYSCPFVSVALFLSFPSYTPSSPLSLAGSLRKVVEGGGGCLEGGRGCWRVLEGGGRCLKGGGRWLDALRMRTSEAELLHMRQSFCA